METKKKFYLLIAIVQVLLIAIVFLSINGIITSVSAISDEDNFRYYNSPTTMVLAIAAALAIGVSGMAAGFVLRTVGTAAISALTEREEAFGKLIVIVALGEAIAIYGLIVALLIVFKIPSPPA